jgi:ABC-type Fe3+-hydroxamate transport system substrate-binding protein
MLYPENCMEVIVMNKIGIIAILAVVVLLASAIPSVSAADSALISITDSRGVTTTLSQPATHVASFGAFATNTLVDIDFLSTAVILDAGSAYAKSGIVEVQNYPADMFVTVSSTNKDAVIQTMLNLVDNATWNKTTDVIFGYGYSSLSPMWAELEGYGFHVITFYPISYDGIVQVVVDIENVVGADHRVSEQMDFVKTYIGETLNENGINEASEKVKALYASYSANTLKLGNGGSVTVDFINYAGGNNVANDTSKTVPTYSADFTAILQLSPEYVLLDGYYTGSAADFSQLIGNDSITVYKMDKSWNSYCPDAMIGLWTIASLFYPEYFSGDVPTIPVVPDSPTDLSAVSSDGYITLSWTAPVNNGGAEIDYYVVYKNGSQETTSTNTSANITGLTNGLAYSFMVAAHNSVGIGNNSTAIIATPAAAVTAPGVPHGLTTVVGDGYVLLSWIAPVNNGGAEIEYYVVYKNGSQETTSTNTTVNITGLSNGHSYSFMVAAHNSVGNGTNSTSISATPAAADIGGSNGNDYTTLIVAGVGILVVVVALVIALRRRK